jgi:uncharacterized membrane protein (Fun14 family)
MAVAPEIAWIVPVVIPLIIGLLVGVIIKHSVRLIFSVTALIILLVATGLISLTFQDIFDRAMDYLPQIIQTGSGLIDILPYSATTFLIGLALGLWKG